MITRSPQEWANFLGMKVACFKISSNRFAYYAIELQDYPFSSVWVKFLDEAMESNKPNKFYKNHFWEMTKMLLVHGYNKVFRSNDNGSVKMLVPVDKLKQIHKFILGNTFEVDTAYKLPTLELNVWDRNVYVPDWIKIN